MAEQFDRNVAPPEGAFNLHNPDEVAAFISEWLRVENGDIHGIPYIAVQIAEAADRSAKADQDRDDYPIDVSIRGRGQDHADIDGLLDRLIAHGISGITTDDFPIIYQALEAALRVAPPDDIEHWKTKATELAVQAHADRRLLEGLMLAARAMVRAARPYTMKDPEMAATWQQLRRSIPIRIVGSSVSDGSPEGVKTQSGLIEDDSAVTEGQTPLPTSPLQEKETRE